MSKRVQIGFLILLVLAIIFLLFNAGLRQYWSNLPFLNTPLVSTPEVRQKPIELPKVLYNLTGMIQSMGKDYIVINATLSRLDKAGKLIQVQEERKAIITPSTRFSQLTFVAQEGTNRKTPRETALKFSDFIRGDYIEVISNKDISTAKEFEATQIRMLPRQ